MAAVKNYQQAARLSLGQDTFVYRILRICSPSTRRSGSNFAAIASPGFLVVLSLINGDLVQERSIQDTHKSITCLEPFNDDPWAAQENIVTAGRDGSVIIWDCSTLKQVRTLKTSDPDDRISAITASDHLGLLAAGTESEREGPGDVTVYVWNLKTPSQIPIRAYTESHTDTITSLYFHLPALPASSPPQLLTASTDGLINILDSSIADEDNALLTTLNANTAVHHMLLIREAAAFRPPGASPLPADSLPPILPYQDAIASVSHDEQLSIRLASPGSSSAPYGALDVRAAVAADYTVWLRRGADGSEIICAGAYKPETAARAHVTIAWVVRDADGNRKLSDEGRVVLNGAHGEEVVRDVWLGEGVAVSVGEDGDVRLWRELVAADNDGEAMAVESPKGKKKRKGEGGGGAGARFRPY